MHINWEKKNLISCSLSIVSDLVAIYKQRTIIMRGKITEGSDG